MAQTNVKERRAKARTQEGAVAMHETPIKRLERVLCAHMLHEDGFYLDGAANADALSNAVFAAAKADPVATRYLIVAARRRFNIRHAPLFAAVIYAQNHFPDARTLIGAVIARADEMAEVLAMANGRLAPHAVMRGIRDVFESGRFDEYQLAKYRGEGKAITQRDAVFLTHPSPKKQPLIQKIVDGTLETPNTWETRLSSGEDKREVFTSLLADNRLGAMALLRNLRNMADAGVDEALIKEALAKANWSKVLPFRFLSAGQTAPRFAQALDDAFRKAVAGSVWLPGRTAVLVDTSASMSQPVSARSVVKAVNAGAALAAAIHGDAVRLFEWADRTRELMTTGGLMTAMSVRCGNVGHGTNAVQAVDHALKSGAFDRMILVSDMQFRDPTTAGFGGVRVPILPKGVKGYTINLGANANAGLMHGDWTHLTGYSAATLNYIATAEGL